MRIIGEEELMVVCRGCGKRLMLVKRDLRYKKTFFEGENTTIRIVPEDPNNTETGYYFVCISCCHINHIREKDHREKQFFGIEEQASEPVLE